MNTGEHLWMIPHGDMAQAQQDAFRDNPLLKGVKNLDTNWGRRGHPALAASPTLLFATGSDGRQPQQPVRHRQEDRQACRRRASSRARAATD